MPGKVGVKIKAGRNLPVMDRGSDTTDAYVEIKLGNVTHKTDVCRKSLNPQWNTDWFRFEVDDAELQDEPLQIRLMDHDTYSANDAIGKVYISLNPLCLETASHSNKGKGAVMSGWIPVFDTMHGIRGEVNIIVKVDLFSDANKFRQSSCGIHFFHSPNIPYGYKAQIIHGFVEELVVNDDPEYQWIDKIRTPRASNEARQVVFLKLSGQVQRKIGLKAINLGANAVIGYTQCFDLEGDVGVVARGIGTAVTLVKIQDTEKTPSLDNALIEERTLKYFEFLKKGGNVNETYKSVFDSDTLNGSSGNVVYKILGINPIERINTRAPNVVLNRRWKPNVHDGIIPEEFEDGDGIIKLLQQEDMRGEKPQKKFHHHVRRITRSSKNLFAEKLSAFRVKNSENKIESGSGGSLNSSLSDISYKESIRSSFTDLRSFIKFKRHKHNPLNHSVSDGSGMASLLVNSVIRGPSLDQISEGKDSVRSTPSQKSKFRHDIKSESTGNLSQSSKKMFLNLNLRQNAIQNSDVSISTTSISSSTTEEERFSDELSETTTPNAEIVVVDADTVSMVVKSVLAQETNNEDSGDWIYPGSTQDENDGSEEMLDQCVKNSLRNLKSQNSYEFDSNGKVCISTGAVRISKIGKNIIDSEIVSKETSATDLENILKKATLDEDADNWIQPGSTTDEPETIDERRDSILHDLKENISETLHHWQEHIHLPHKLQKHKTLDDNSINFGRETQRVKLLETRRGSLDTITRKLHLSFGTKNNKHGNEIVDESGMIGNAMKTILMEPLKLADEIEKEIKTSSLSITNNNNNNSENANIEKDKTNENKENNFNNEKRKTVTTHSFSTIQKSNPEIVVINDDVSFYNSEPDLSSPSELKIPFSSLTNLNASTSNLLSPFHNNSLNIANTSINTCNCISTPISPYFRNPLHPHSSLSYSSPSKYEFNNPLNKSFLEVTNTSSTLSVTQSLENARNINNNNNNNNNILSSSDTNLTTNKAKTLAPFPYLKHNRSELIAATALAVATSNATTTPVICPISIGGGNSTCTNGKIIASSNNITMTETEAITTTSTSTITSSSSSSVETMKMTTTTTTNVIGISGHNRAESVGGCKLSQSPAKTGYSVPGGSLTSSANKEKDKDNGIYRRSSDSDLSVTPKGNSLCVASERLVAATTLMRSSTKAPTQENLDMLEYPFLTMAKYPPGFILHLGATVAARSVKLLERVPNPDEPETRDSWWTELRMEIRSHARALSCNVILGYSESTTISDDVCVLSATGTAAVINMSYNGDTSQFDLSSNFKKEMVVSSLDERECLKDTKNSIIGDHNLNSAKELSSSFSGTTKVTASIHTAPKPLSRINFGCSMCHIPYSQSSIPFNVKMKKCAICKRGKVPDVLLTTIEIPECLKITGRSCFMQAQVVRPKKDLRSESNAKEISDGLPFLEYELHRLIINKLKAKGMNAIFGLKSQIVIGEKMMALIATGTAIYLTSLPSPSVPKIVAGNSWTDMAKLRDLQKSLQETVERNKEIYQLKCLDPDFQQQNGKQSDTDDSDDEIAELDLTTGNRDTCVLEVDDIEDLEIISLLMEPCPPEGFHVVNTQFVPALQDLEVVRNLRMFTQIWRAKLCVGQNSGNLAKHFQRLLQTIFFKLRTMIPCAICDLRFRLDLPESDEIQVLVTGMALGLDEISKFSKMRRKTLSCGTESPTQLLTNGLPLTVNKKPQDDELIFSLDEDQAFESPNQQANNTAMTTLTKPLQAASMALSQNYGSHSLRYRKGSPSRIQQNNKFTKHTSLKERYGVDITPLSYVPGGKIEKYLGNLNFFFIRESTSVRENGGISGFVHSFITELLGVVRAHVTALGGNAMVSFYMTELLLVDNQHKNQGQCLISIGGDVVYVTYFTDD